MIAVCTLLLSSTFNAFFLKLLLNVCEFQNLFLFFLRIFLHCSHFTFEW